MISPAEKKHAREERVSLPKELARRRGRRVLFLFSLLLCFRGAYFFLIFSLLFSYDKKKKLREALREGKPIPTELMSVARELQSEIEFDDDKGALKSSKWKRNRRDNNWRKLLNEKIGEEKFSWNRDFIFLFSIIVSAHSRAALDDEYQRAQDVLKTAFRSFSF